MHAQPSRTWQRDVNRPAARRLPTVALAVLICCAAAALPGRASALESAGTAVRVATLAEADLAAQLLRGFLSVSRSILSGEEPSLVASAGLSDVPPQTVQAVGSSVLAAALVSRAGGRRRRRWECTRRHHPRRRHQACCHRLPFVRRRKRVCN